MIRFILFVLLIYLGYSLYRTLTRALPGGKGGDLQAKSRHGEEMVADPQCGTYLPRGDAVEKVLGGKRHFFCSEECRDAYIDKNKRG
jgi:uncharacterized protein